MTVPLHRDDPSVTIEPGRGVYDTRRAAALAGVPLRTLNDWARNGVYRPSISPHPRGRLWSWFDLIALRAIDWIRRTGSAPDVPTVPFRSIRQTLQQLDKEGLSRDAAHALAVSPRGEFFTMSDHRLAVRATPDRQIASPDILPLVAPYGARGPDLLEPRPLLRIIPGKLHGEPHVLNTRIPSAALYSLHRSGYTDAQILEMYPDVSAEALRQAVDLEESLQGLAA
jgi:uncharacterized protein (DUF433 family)/DNA-binding transcriptional MerR regulator